MCNPWTNFLMCDLTEIMCKQGDKEFITLLNSLRIGNFLMIMPECCNSLNFFIKTLINDVNALFAENDPKDQYN